MENRKKKWASIILPFFMGGTLLVMSGCGDDAQDAHNAYDAQEQKTMENADSDLRSGRYGRAVEIYNMVLEMNPSQENARYKRNESKKIIDLANRLIAQGDEAIKAHKMDVAYDLFKKAADLYPGNPDNAITRNKALFEIDHLQYYLDCLTELNTRWQKIKKDLKHGSKLSSDNIEAAIKELYPLAQQFADMDVNMTIKRPSSPGAIALMKSNKEQIDYIKTELAVYQVLPYEHFYLGDCGYTLDAPVVASRTTYSIFDRTRSDIPYKKAISAFLDR
ncbi:hypothetical protein [Paenibacillus sp.]|uniref:hypothetical protein n=1 Tax=Paenibacillus sp. TaxID=58172 RepID=UPI00281EE353|nr:hypothetical protein [Paenibacillus sp.]MDR0268829.1 hypothetical protein [Paenibacillus sp.]